MEEVIYKEWCEAECSICHRMLNEEDGYKEDKFINNKYVWSKFVCIDCFEKSLDNKKNNENT